MIKMLLKCTHAVESVENDDVEIMYQVYRDVISDIKLFVKGTDYLRLKNSMQQKSLCSMHE